MSLLYEKNKHNYLLINNRSCLVSTTKKIKINSNYNIAIQTQRFQFDFPNLIISAAVFCTLHSSAGRNFTPTSARREDIPFSSKVRIIVCFLHVLVCKVKENIEGTILLLVSLIYTSCCIFLKSFLHLTIFFSSNLKYSLSNILQVFLLSAEKTNFPNCEFVWRILV